MQTNGIMTDLPVKGRGLCCTQLLSSPAWGQAVLSSSCSASKAHPSPSHMSSRDTLGRALSSCPPTPYLPCSLHRTQNTFCASVSFNLSWAIQMDPQEAYTEHIIGKRRISCSKAELGKYQNVFCKDEKLPRGMSV